MPSEDWLALGEPVPSGAPDGVAEAPGCPPVAEPIAGAVLAELGDPPGALPTASRGPGNAQYGSMGVGLASMPPAPCVTPDAWLWSDPPAASPVPGPEWSADVEPPVAVKGEVSAPGDATVDATVCAEAGLTHNPQSSAITIAHTPTECSRD